MSPPPSGFPGRNNRNLQRRLVASGVESSKAAAKTPQALFQPSEKLPIPPRLRLKNNPRCGTAGSTAGHPVARTFDWPSAGAGTRVGGFGNPGIHPTYPVKYPSPPINHRAERWLTADVAFPGAPANAQDLVGFRFLLTLPLAHAARKPKPSSIESAHLPPAAIATLQNIDPEKIRAHVRYLSLDLLEGRGTGQRGGDIAAEYIATQFWLYGLKPAGDNGTFFQKVPMVGITPAPETAFDLVPNKGDALKLKPLDDYVAYDETERPSDDIDAPIVFVGYGIEAPEYKWDDYKGVDVKGKVLLMLVNEPSNDEPNFFKGRALTYYGRWTYKYEEAARKGAVGVILQIRNAAIPQCRAQFQFRRKEFPKK
jgi:hypothetical protein